MKYFLAGLAVVLSFQFARAQDSKAPLAWEYYNNREYEKAAPLFLQMYEKNSIRTYLTNYVYCLIETRDYDTAIKALRKAIRETREISLYVDLGFVYETSGDPVKAQECYKEPLKQFPQSVAGIASLGNTYLNYVQTTYAEMTYELGRKILGNPEEFRMEMANVYFAQRNFSAMLDEYFGLILNQPQYLPTVQAMILNALNHDVDQTLLLLTREKCYTSIQQLPGVSVFYDMLIWVLIQEKNFMEAVDQTIAMERRDHSSGDKTLQIARISVDGGDLDAAIKAYQSLIDKGPGNQVPAQPGRSISDNSLYRTARIEYLLTLSEMKKLNPGTDSDTWLQLTEDFGLALNELGRTAETGQLFLELARIKADYLSDYQEALKILNEALSLPGSQPGFRAESLLLKGDILLSSGDPWEATFTYSMVDMENPDNPAGSTARLRKAQLAWYTGDISWAMAQLDVLKGSTSKPIANDAFELSLLIRENQSETDMSQLFLKELASIDYLIFRKEYDEALVKADSVLQVTDKEEPVRDDVLYKKGRILFALGHTDQAIRVWEELTDRYRYDYWGHKALYELGCFYQDQLKNPEKATGLFENFIVEFPNSFYFLDARDRLKVLIGKAQ
ncbi:MAG: tetratricopeptide repeat protein [Bacteroidota bacterium]